MQGCKQEIDMTIEQLQEENVKLRQAIIDIWAHCDEVELNRDGVCYAVNCDIVDDAYYLVRPHMD